MGESREGVGWKRGGGGIRQRQSNRPTDEQRVRWTEEQRDREAYIWDGQKTRKDEGKEKERGREGRREQNWDRGLREGWPYKN